MSTLFVFFYRSSIDACFLNVKRFYFSRYLGGGLGDMHRGPHTAPMLTFVHLSI